jgi:hypothetical protein
MVKNFTKNREKRTTTDTPNSGLGTIQEVFQHDNVRDAGEEISNHEATVTMRGRSRQYNRIPIHTDHNGSIYVPEIGDVVEVSFIKGKQAFPFISSVVYTDDTRAPLARPGHFRRQFGEPGDGQDDLFFEAEPADHSKGRAETLRLALKQAGLDDPKARIEVDKSGSDTILRITRGEAEQGNTDMGLELNLGTGELALADGSGFGIESDGSGNFKWYANSVDIVSDGSTVSFD